MKSFVFRKFHTEHLHYVETPELQGEQEVQHLHGERGGLHLSEPGLPQGGICGALQPATPDRYGKERLL